MRYFSEAVVLLLACLLVQITAAPIGSPSGSSSESSGGSSSSGSRPSSTTPDGDFPVRHYNHGDVVGVRPKEYEHKPPKGVAIHPGIVVGGPNGNGKYHIAMISKKLPNDPPQANILNFHPQSTIYGNVALSPPKEARPQGMKPWKSDKTGLTETSLTTEQHNQLMAAMAPHHSWQAPPPRPKTPQSNTHASGTHKDGHNPKKGGSKKGKRTGGKHQPNDSRASSRSRHPGLPPPPGHLPQRPPSGQMEGHPSSSHPYSQHISGSGSPYSRPQRPSPNRNTEHRGPGGSPNSRGRRPSPNRYPTTHPYQPAYNHPASYQSHTGPTAPHSGPGHHYNPQGPSMASAHSGHASNHPHALASPHSPVSGQHPYGSGQYYGAAQLPYNSQALAYNPQVPYNPQAPHNPHALYSPQAPYNPQAPHVSGGQRGSGGHRGQSGQQQHRHYPRAINAM